MDRARSETVHPSTTDRDLVARSAALLDAVRTTAPLVQCITNGVVQNVTANVLLALGASAAMVDVPDEAGPFARVAGGLLVNLGTPHAEQRTAMREAVDAANDSGTPWVLDPVAIGVLPVRTALAAELVARRPTIVRGNASEIRALAGHTIGGRGVDATDEPEDALGAAWDTNGRHGAAVAMSGPVDLVVGRVSAGGAGGAAVVARIANGSPLLTRITGGGCALGAVMAAVLAVAEVGPERGFVSAVAATTIHCVAAEIAAEHADGPGSFQPALLDALAALSPDDLVRRARLRVDTVDLESGSAEVGA